MLYNFNINKKANSFLVIDVDAIVSNYQTLRSKLTKAYCAATLKANAYGLGIKKIAPALDKAGCQTFFVATLDEAVELRKILTSKRKSILVLNGFLTGTGPIFKQYNITPVLNNFCQLEKWVDFNATLNERQKAALHLDTGMNRLGLDNTDFRRLMKNPQILIKANIYMLLSHLACSDEPKNTMNNRQLLEFNSLIKRLPRLTASLANSGGIYLGKKFHFDLVRPGLALYGSVPGHLQNNLKNLVESFNKKNSDFKGVDNSLASHLDIYPTVAELIGYKNPFRSWGRSLLSAKNEPSFTINYFGGGAYLSMDENFICVYDGNKAIGFYNLSDLNLEENLIQNINHNMLRLEKKTGLFLQDYFNRIVSNNMYYNPK